MEASFLKWDLKILKIRLKTIIYYNMEFILIYNWPKLKPKFFIINEKLILYRLLLSEILPYLYLIQQFNMHLNLKFIIWKKVTRILVSCIIEWEKATHNPKVLLSGHINPLSFHYPWIITTRININIAIR